MKCEIEIDGLPIGYVPVRYGKPLYGEFFIDDNGDARKSKANLMCGYMIIKKQQPKIRVFERVSDAKRAPRLREYFETLDGDVVMCKLNNCIDEYHIFKEITYET